MKIKVLWHLIVMLMITLAAAGTIFLPSGTTVSGQQRSRGWRV